MNSLNLAPILIFCYNRKEHLKKLINSLLENNLSCKSDLIIYSDGPKNEKDFQEIDDLRNYLSTINGFKSIEIIKNSSNYGLAKSVISGVSTQIKKHKKVIVLEDDLIVSQFFLSYMNDMLNMYQDDISVASVHGYVYPAKNLPNSPFFIQGADCWGWGTWERAWDIFNENGSELLNKLMLNKLDKKFDFDYTFPYIKMLQDQISGKNNSWAIKWNASAFVKNMYTLYPPESFVMNIGFDCSGTNCQNSVHYDVKMVEKYTSFRRVEISESVQGYLALKKYFIKINGGYLKFYIKRLVSKWN